MASRKQDSHQANQREMSHCSKKILVLRNELRETENIGATDLDELIANFLLQVREFLFLISLVKSLTGSLKILKDLQRPDKDL